MILLAGAWLPGLPGSLLPGGELKVGNRAPDFDLPCATKDSIYREGVRLSEIVGSSAIVLAFYPADWSSGCTKEMCSIRDSYSSLSELGALVYGISGDYVFSHREWARHLDLQFALLSDHDHSVARAYESFDGTSGYNKRTVFVIDRKGDIAYMDLAYSVRSSDSFDRLKAALAKVD
jgi:peroxiredoxin